MPKSMKPATQLRLSLPEHTTVSLPLPGPEDARPPGTRVVVETTLLPGLSTNLFVQAHLSEHEAVAVLMTHAPVGAVLTLEHKNYKKPLHMAMAGVAALREACPDRPDILLDRNLYSGGKGRPDALFGTHRKTGADGLDRHWVQDQLGALRLRAALTDSGYCATLPEVKHVLNAAAPFPTGTLTLLPIPFQMIRDEAPTLADLARNHPHPVAIILEHEDDPFSEEGVAAGCVHLIGALQQPPVFLRMDTSGLGLISHGAAAAAIGTHSEHRHLFPLIDDGGGHIERLAFVIPDLVGYYLEEKFLRAYTRTPTLQTWRCPCWFCNGRDLTWIASQPRALQRQAAFQHSVAAIAELGARLQKHTDQGIAGPAAWDLMCGHAQATHDEVTSPSGSTWEPQAALKHWREVTRTLTRGATPHN